MLKALNRVRAAIAPNTLVPALLHIHLYDGRVQAGNGNVFIDAPTSLDLNITVPAARFVAAIEACKGAHSISITENRATVTGKKFKAWVPLLSAYPAVEATKGERNECLGICGVLRQLYEFIGTDASRPWGCAVLFKDGYAWATNNKSLIRVPTQVKVTVELPHFVVTELLNVEDEPASFSVASNSVTFFYADGVWLRSQLFAVNWPDIARFATIIEQSGDLIPEGLVEAVETLSAFVQDSKLPVLLLSEKGVATQEGDHFAEIADIELPNCAHDSRLLRLVLPKATHVKFASSGPNVFYNEHTKVRGLFTPFTL